MLCWKVKIDIEDVVGGWRLNDGPDGDFVRHFGRERYAVRDEGVEWKMC